MMFWPGTNLHWYMHSSEATMAEGALSASDLPQGQLALMLAGLHHSYWTHCGFSSVQSRPAVTDSHRIAAEASFKSRNRKAIQGWSVPDTDLSFCNAPPDPSPIFYFPTPCGLNLTLTL